MAYMGPYARPVTAGIRRTTGIHQVFSPMRPRSNTLFSSADTRALPRSRQASIEAAVTGHTKASAAIGIPGYGWSSVASPRTARGDGQHGDQREEREG